MQMVAQLQAGAIEAFCVGEPWNDQLVGGALGATACITGKIWANRPEKSLACTPTGSRTTPVRPRRWRRR
jgi:nitrate/nitrite transport system substrate-binding protein